MSTPSKKLCVNKLVEIDNEKYTLEEFLIALNLQDFVPIAKAKNLNFASLLNIHLPVNGNLFKEWVPDKNFRDLYATNVQAVLDGRWKFPKKNKQKIEDEKIIITSPIKKKSRFIEETLDTEDLLFELEKDHYNKSNEVPTDKGALLESASNSIKPSASGSGSNSTREVEIQKHDDNKQKSSRHVVAPLKDGRNANVNFKKNLLVDPENRLDPENPEDPENPDDPENPLNSENLDDPELDEKFKEALEKIGNVLNNYKGRKKECIDFLKYDVYEVLLTDSEGVAVLANFYRRKKLLETERISLCDVIVKDLFKRRIYSLKAFEYKQLADRISEQFPSEKADLYYIPKNAETKDQTGGRLFHKFNNNYRRYIREPGLAESRNSSSNKISFPPLKFDGETHKDKLDWLTTHHEPWDEVRSLWKETIDVRHFQLRNNEVEVQQLFTIYGPLAGARGYELVSIDFDALYPDAPSFEHIFDLNFNKLANYRKNKFKPVVKPYIKNCERSVVRTDDATNLNRLRCLPGFVPPQNHYQGKKVSIAESEKHFLYVAASFEEIKTYHAGLIKEIKKSKREPYPVVAVTQGELKNKIEGKYLLFGDHRYSFEQKEDGREYSLLEVIDLAFKFFITFDLHYPEQSLALWTFLQQGYYKIFRDKDRTMSGVLTIMNDLKL